MGLGVAAKYLRFLLNVQLVVMLVLTTIVFVVGGVCAAKSALTGAFAFIIPSTIFGCMVCQYKGAREAKKIVRAFYKGESIKIIFSVLLFAIIFNFIKIMPLVFFCVYFCMQVATWFAFFIMKTDASVQNSI